MKHQARSIGFGLAVAAAVALLGIVGSASAGDLVVDCSSLGVSTEAVQGVFGAGAQALLEIRGTQSYCAITVSATAGVSVEVYPSTQASMILASYETSGVDKQALSGLGSGAVYLHSGKPTPDDLVLFTSGSDFVVINGLGGSVAVASASLTALANSISTSLASTPATLTTAPTTTTTPVAGTTTTTTTTTATPSLSNACPATSPLAHLGGFCLRQPTTLPGGGWIAVASKSESGPKPAAIGGRVEKPRFFAVKITASRPVWSQINYSLSCYQNGGEQISRMTTIPLQRTPILVLLGTTRTPYCNLLVTASKSTAATMSLSVFAQR